MVSSIESFRKNPAQPYIPNTTLVYDVFAVKGRLAWIHAPRRPGANLKLRRAKNTLRLSGKSTRSKLTRDDLVRLGESIRAFEMTLTPPTWNYGAVDVTPHVRSVIERSMRMCEPPSKAKRGPTPDPRTMDVLVECVRLERRGRPDHQVAYRRWPNESKREARKRLSTLKSKAKRSGLYDEIKK